MLKTRAQARPTLKGILSRLHASDRFMQPPKGSTTQAENFGGARSLPCGMEQKVKFAGEAIVNKHVEAIGIMPHLHATA